MLQLCDVTHVFDNSTITITATALLRRSCDATTTAHTEKATSIPLLPLTLAATLQKAMRACQRYGSAARSTNTPSLLLLLLLLLWWRRRLGWCWP
jgi:hypothetical protein